MTQQLANQKDAFNSNSVFSHGIDGFVDRLSGLSCSGNFEQPRRLSSSQAETAAPSNGLESPLRDTESIETIRSRIFGTHIGNGLRSGRKVLSKKLLGPVVEAYYPKDIFAGDPLLVDLDAERYAPLTSWFGRT